MSWWFRWRVLSRRSSMGVSSIWEMWCVSSVLYCLMYYRQNYWWSAGISICGLRVRTWK
jgi:hypothetical protein